MAILNVNFRSGCLMRNVGFWMILPNEVGMLPKEALPEFVAGNKNYERPMKVLYLLHGFGGDMNDWMLGVSIQEIALKYHLAVVMPSGENSFYLNGCGVACAYEDYVGKELVDYTRRTFGLSARKEDTFIGGLSMGGFGSIHTGLKYPETFGKIFGLSSALIIHNICGMKPGEVSGFFDYEYYRRTFGDLDRLKDSENNPEYVIDRRIKAGEHIQPIFMACGTEDFLLKENRAFKDFLTERNLDVTYLEDTGKHDWEFWGKCIEPAVKWAVEE